MKRVLVSVGIVSVLLGGFSEPAFAAPKKAKSAKNAAKVAASAEISKSMGELKWGMPKDDVIKHFTDKVREKYRPLIAKAHDPVDEDRLRQEANEELRRIKESYVMFTGKTTGWDVSFLKGEFTHGNDESMLVIRDDNSQNFYFFMGGRLWKWYKAFNAAVFDADNFNAFAAAVNRKFGEGTDQQGELAPGAGKRRWLEWQDDTSRLRAIDQTDFYGFYCLVFDERSTLGQLARLRTNVQDTNKGGHAMVDSVTSDDGAGESDDSPNIVDRISGKLRVRENAPAEESPSAKGASKRSNSSSSSSAPAGVSADDDPLQGLGL